MVGRLTIFELPAPFPDLLLSLNNITSQLHQEAVSFFEEIMFRQQEQNHAGRRAQCSRHCISTNRQQRHESGAIYSPDRYLQELRKAIT